MKTSIGDPVPRHLSPEALQTMIALAERKSFAAAAEQMHLTQAAISQQVKRLEMQLGQPVFQKIGRRMVLTDAGLMLVEHARKILGAQQDALLALQGHRADGVLRLGVPQDYAEDMLPAVLRKFAKRYPRIRLEARVEKNQTLLQEMRESQLDIILALSEAKSATFKALAKPDIDWLASKDFVWGDAELPLVLLDAPCMFRSRALEALARANVAHRIAYSTGSLSGARAAVAAGLGVMARIYTRRDASLGIVNVRQAHRTYAKRLPKFERLAATVWRNDSLSPPGHELADILEQGVCGDW
jgi:DNA-binding transcriptional LysR family regulator